MIPKVCRESIKALNIIFFGKIRKKDWPIVLGSRVRAFSKTAQERNRLHEKCLRCDLCKTKIIIINEQTFEIVCTLVHGFATVFGLDINFEKDIHKTTAKKELFSLSAHLC